MSGSDSGLTDQERAILAGLAEKAAADDPLLANRLSGGRRLDRVHLPDMPVVTEHWACGLLCALVGLAVAVIGVSLSVIVGVVGILFMVFGALLSLSAWHRNRRPHQPDHG